jgi:hypothetical protein
MAAPLMGKKNKTTFICFFVFTAAKRRSYVKALRKRDARNV